MDEFNYYGFLDGVGIVQGDILDVASDMLSLVQYCKQKKLKFDVNKLIDVLKDLVGETGTVMIRTFTWDFCKGISFDISKSPSRVGALGNVAMKRADFKRTKHPLYSWMVWGCHKDKLCALENVEAFGEDSPFDYLVKNEAKFLSIGNMRGPRMTLIHYVEYLCRIPYRCEKVFEGYYIDDEGNKSIRRYTMFVRPLNYAIEDIIDENSELFWRSLITAKKRYDNEITVEVSPCRLICEVWTKELLENDAATVFKFEGTPGYKASGINWNTARYYA